MAMKRAKQVKNLQLKSSPKKNYWLDFITNGESHKPVIPVGPRFQANIPDWIGPPSSEYYSDLSSTKWLGTQFWPIKDKSSQTKVTAVGKGRHNTCLCASPGSMECVKRHVSDEKLNLQFELGKAFWEWKFDEMGDDISKIWKFEEQKELDSIIKKSCSLGNNFLEPALERFPSKNKKNIISYYFNVYIPNRMKIQTRSGCELIDLDADEYSGAHFPENSQKRCRADGAKASSGKCVKKKYLNRRR